MPLTEVLIVAGDQVPLIPLSEIVGKIGATEPEHTAAGIDPNVGVVVDAQLLQLLEIGNVTQGYPGADTIVNVTLCPGKTPKTSYDESVVETLTNGPPFIE